ncbi:MAG: FecR family protein [Tenacibaculum sp.]
MDFNYYKGFTIEEFAEDTSFKKWVLYKDKHLNLFWSSLIENHPELQNNIIEAKELVICLHKAFKESSTESYSDSSYSEDFMLRLEEEIKYQSNSRIKNIFAFKRISKTAQALVASVLLLVCSTIIYVLSNSKSTETIHYSTGFGQWKSIVLPDNSVVELNANSLLTVAKSWKKNNAQNVWLSGEAFFRVKKKPSVNSKFTVKTKDLKLEVLGTSFSVNSRFDKTEVFLEEGKIELNLGTTKKEIVAGEFIAFSKKNKQIITRHKQTNNAHSNWKNGVLTLKNKELTGILNEIKAVYGLEINVENKNVLHEKKTISIPVDDLKLTIEILKRTLETKIELKNNILTIQQKSTP